MNRRIIAWMLASCMAMSMAGPVLAEAAAGTDNNVTADSKEPAESNTDTKETTDKGEAGTTEGETSKTEEENGKTEEENGKTEGETGKTEGETGKTEGETGKTEGEGADANGTPANSETPQPNNALNTTADETTALAEGDVDLAGIADQRIRSRALAKASVTGSTVVTANQLKSITDLDISGLGIQDLSGIDLLTSLTSLNASKNDIANLGVVSWDKLTSLKTLDLSENKVGTLSPLNASKLETLKLNKQRPEDKGTVLDLDITTDNLNITTLKTLEVRDCNLGSLAVANALTTLIASDNPKLSGAVSQLQDSVKSSLEKLDLSNCNIQDAGGLSGFTALSDLNLSGNTPLADTSIITGLSGLEKLNLSGTSITGLTGISKSSKLVTLDVSNTKMENFGTLGAGNKSTLTTLNASNAPIQTLTGLSGFTKISKLDVSGTQITDTQGLENLSSLKANNESLNLTGTRIKTSGDLTTGLPSSVTGDSSNYNSWLAALKTNLGIDDSNGIEQAKNVLETLIGDAQKLLDDTAVSVNGSDVPTNKKWVVQSAATAFTKAISDAQTALNAFDATESSLADARAALGTAQTTFTTARKTGTQAVIETEVLSTAIGNAKATQAIPKVDTAADNVLEGQKWVTQLEKDALDTAITKARALLEKATATPDAVTQEELNTAAATLDTAVQTFQDAYKSGTKKASFKDGLSSALNNQNGFVKSVIASTDGRDVPYSKNWAQQADIDKFKAEIAKAQAIYDKEGATEQEVTTAVNDLNAARVIFDKACALGTQKVAITKAANPTTSLTLPLNGIATIKVSDLATDCGETHGDLIIKSAAVTTSASTVTTQIATDKKSVEVKGTAAGDVSLTITVSCNHMPCNAEEDFMVACKVNSVITAFEPLEDVDAGAEDALTDDFKDLTAAAAKLKTLYGTVTVKGASATATVDSWECTSANANSYPAAGTYVFTAKLNTTPPTDYTYGEGVKATVNVVVKPGNNAPTAKTVPTQTVKVGGAKATLPVSSLASDADNDALTIAKVTQPTDGSATVTYTNDTLTITPVKAGNGSTTVTVSDGKGSVDVTVNITVNEAASIPEKTIPDRQVAVKSVDEINVSDLAADCTDGHKNLKIVSASSSVAGNATVVFDDAKATVTGVAAGDATITVKVACGGASGTTCAAQREFTVKYTVKAEAAEKFTLTQNATNATVEFYTDAQATDEVTGSEVNKGSQVWVKVTPNADHEISAFTINGADKKADLNSSNIAGPYTINQNTTVSASAVQIDHTPTVTIKNATGTYKVEPPTTTTNKYTVTVTLKLPTGFKAEKVQYYVDGDPSSAQEITATAANGVYSFAADPDKAYIVFVTTAADDSYKKVEISKDVTAITTAVVKEDQIPDVPTDQPNGKSVVLTISNPAVPATPDELEAAGTTLAAQNSNIQAIDTDKAIQMDISLYVLDASNKKVGEVQPKSGGITVLMNVPAAFKGKDFLALHYKDNTTIPTIIYPNILEGGEQFSITTSSLSTFVLAPYTKASRPTPTPSPTPSNNGSGGGSGGGGGGSSSGGRSTGIFDKLTNTINGLLKQALTGVKPGTASGTVSNGTPVTAAAANKAAASAIAKGKGDGSGKADVLFRNASTISPEILSSIASQAQKAGLKAYVTVDSMQKGAVDVRVSVLASAAARLGKAIDLSARTGNQTIERHFAKYFKNRIAVIDLAQNGPFGTPASVAARVNLGADAKDLHVYAYNVATNAYREIPQKEIFVDSNGYVHFTTDTGGCIILSVGTLTRK